MIWISVHMQLVDGVLIHWGVFYGYRKIFIMNFCPQICEIFNYFKHTKSFHLIRIELIKKILYYLIQMIFF